MRVALSVVFCTMLPFISAPVGAAQPTLGQAFEEANVAASRGDYAEAIRLYSEVIEAGVQDPDVYFNLGTAFAQSGDYPRAILSYERALTLRPNDAGAATNLVEAEKALEAQRVDAEGEAMIHRRRAIGEAAYGRVSSETLAYLLLVANLLFFAGLGWAWASRGGRRPGLAPLLAVSGALLVFSALGLAVKSGVFRAGPRAVVLEDRVDLREGPDPRARVRGQARAGDRGEIIGRPDHEFVRFRVVGGPEGWVAADQVGRIDLRARTD